MIAVLNDSPIREFEMAITNILVHVDDSKACPARLTSAVKLAQGFEAHLTALYVVPHYQIPVYAEVPIQEVIEVGRKAMWEDAHKCQETSEQLVKRLGSSMEWRALEGDYVNVLTENARYADLMVLGQPNPDDEEDMRTGVVSKVILDSGRPNLIIPYVGSFHEIGKRILIAWNASRESTRAVNDAMSLLEKADSVEVMSVNPQKQSVDEGDLPSADISRHLARHGFKVEARSTVAKDIDAGNLLISHATDIGADLIVMGAYGHSRFRETVLGGVTREMLKHMTVPVLMSH